MMANVSELQRIHAVCVGPMTPERLPVVVVASPHAFVPLPSSLWTLLQPIARCPPSDAGERILDTFFF